MIELEPISIIKETELAWLIEYEDKTYWVPKAECNIKGSELEIPFWMAEAKGMI